MPTHGQRLWRLASDPALDDEQVKRMAHLANLFGVEALEDISDFLADDYALYLELQEAGY